MSTFSCKLRFEIVQCLVAVQASLTAVCRRYSVFVLEASTSNRLTYFLPPLVSPRLIMQSDCALLLGSAVYRHSRHIILLTRVGSRREGNQHPQHFRLQLSFAWLSRLAARHTPSEAFGGECGCPQPIVMRGPSSRASPDPPDQQSMPGAAPACIWTRHLGGG